MLAFTYFLIDLGFCIATASSSTANCGVTGNSLPCNGHGSCENGACVCNPGFEGVYCELATTSTAPNYDYCNYGGELHGNVCQCRENYSGARCETFTCTRNTDCFNGGICYRENLFKGSYCVCPKGFSGADCNVMSCNATWDNIMFTTVYCNNGGTCHMDEPSSLHNYYRSWCECRQNFNGTTCDKFTCSTKSGDGKSKTNLCPIYSKDDNGQLIQPNCESDDTIGEYCGPCPSHRGGLDCGIVYCGAEEVNGEIVTCSGHGHCMWNFCFCRSEYLGDTCNEMPCTLNDTKCGTHGTCTLYPDSDSPLGYCKCNDGYIGNFCEKCKDPLKGHPYYKVESDGRGGYNVKESTTICAEPACIIDGLVCNNAGTCVLDKSTNQWGCQCDQGFEKDPITRMCIPNDGSCFRIENICGGHGVCEFHLNPINNTAKWECRCRPFYMLDTVTNSCSPASCFASSDSTAACSGHGECLPTFECFCSKGCTGTFCEKCGLSGGTIAGIVIAILIIAGSVIGFCIYWFLFRNKMKKGSRITRSRLTDAVDYASLINNEDSGHFI
ncbi:High cysteine membrane protein [Giardia muris]|uniref:High cysteine membrane protein n=1 Tax=Giardia muris TaxID=5742 RepID=A0A4Z1SWS2_GIAMU|nr:High cysteine membrane protein [Giardia muris]|eukprot:TNJ30204.1 High cysteine membrane protein [Giardia muris]